MRRQNGFTLLEMLVTVGVITLLAGILIPAVSRGRSAAYDTVCRSNLHAAGVGMRMYLDDNNEIMPIAATLPSANLNDDPRIVDVLDKYLSGPKTLKCPADQPGKYPNSPGKNESYFALEGSSYEYSAMLGGSRLQDSHFIEHAGRENAHIMFDYEPFHAGSSNWLFADWHVGR